MFPMTDIFKNNNWKKIYKYFQIFLIYIILKTSVACCNLRLAAAEPFLIQIQNHSTIIFSK